MSVERFLFAPLRSSAQEIRGSRLASVDVSAAETSKTKNSTAIMVPKGIVPNAIGRVRKTRPVPSAGDSPKPNTMGKIANPATSATRVSAETMMSDDFITWMFFGMYAP